MKPDPDEGDRKNRRGFIGSADSSMRTGSRACEGTGQRRNAVLPQERDFVSDRPIDSRRFAQCSAARETRRIHAQPSAFGRAQSSARDTDHTS